MSTEKFCLASEAKAQRKDNSSSQGKSMTYSLLSRLLMQDFVFRGVAVDEFGYICGSYYFAINILTS